MAGFTAEWKHYQERWPHREDKAERRNLGRAAERELELGCDKIQSAESADYWQAPDIEAESSSRRTLTDSSSA